MSASAYPARFARAAEGGWLIAFRDFPTGHSQGEEGDDIIDIAEGLLQACIEGNLFDGLEVPEPSEARAGEVLITVPIETATKAALFKVVAASGRSQVAIAEALDMDEKEVRRMLDPRHASKLPRVAQVLKAFGKELRLSVVDVAKPPRTGGTGMPEAREPRAGYRARRVSPVRGASRHPRTKRNLFVITVPMKKVSSRRK